MKNKIKYILAGCCLMTTFSCSDFLERYPLDKAVNDTYWKTEAQLRAALYPCYEGLQYDLIINLGEACAETVVWGDPTSGLSKVSGGTSSAQDNFPFYNYWRDIYGHIFDCNNFLDNYNAADVPQETKDVYAAEVKVIRALQYFWLTSVWGDVPLIDKVISSEEAYGPRNPKEEVVDWMIEDLKWAAEKLSPEIQTGQDVGRIDRWGALALMARIALQNQRYELAEKVSKYILDNSPYDLYDYEKVYHLEGNSENDPDNKESIIYSLYVKDIRMNNLTNYTCTPVNYIRLNASKTFVDAFLCTDGKPATTGLEYYKRTDVAVSPLSKYPVTHYADYFKDRDPRMKMTLYTPGDAWPGGDDGDAGNRVNATFGLPRFASLQGNNNNGANTKTGFYFKKYNSPELAGLTDQDHNNINVIRYPEIILIYAEALFNQQGETLTQDQIDETINRLRNRVGMHPMKLSELEAWNMDLKTELRRERRIEMSFDGMRYFDILRWKEGFRLGRAITCPSLEVCMNELGGCPYVDDQDNPIVDEFGDVVYDKSTAEGGSRNFDESKHYLWPVPYQERLKNPSLGQNPGW